MKYLTRSLFILMLSAGLLFEACTKEDEPIPTSDRASLTGTWLVYESKKNTYEVTITLDNATANGLLISNFAAAGTNVQAIAYLSGTTLSLTNNELLSNGWIVNGSGTVSGNTQITWPYTLHDGANQYSIQALFTKK